MPGPDGGRRGRGGRSRADRRVRPAARRGVARVDAGRVAGPRSVHRAGRRPHGGGGCGHGRRTAPPASDAALAARAPRGGPAGAGVGQRALPPLQCPAPVAHRGLGPDRRPVERRARAAGAAGLPPEQRRPAGRPDGRRGRRRRPALPRRPPGDGRRGLPRERDVRLPQPRPRRGSSRRGRGTARRTAAAGAGGGRRDRGEHGRRAGGSGRAAGGVAVHRPEPVLPGQGAGAVRRRSAAAVRAVRRGRRPFRAGPRPELLRRGGVRGRAEQRP